ncbi:hypothetical protein EAN93_00010 [Klebsiella pneumoniae]|nr:hypothetical protein EAN93_00010 [Klebsiella pneumoniae]
MTLKNFGTFGSSMRLPQCVINEFCKLSFAYALLNKSFGKEMLKTVRFVITLMILLETLISIHHLGLMILKPDM